VFLKVFFRIHKTVWSQNRILILKIFDPNSQNTDLSPISIPKFRRNGSKEKPVIQSVIRAPKQLLMITFRRTSICRFDPKISQVSMNKANAIFREKKTENFNFTT